MWVSYMCTTHTLQLERPDHVGGQLLCVRQGHAHHSVRLRPSTGPVLKWNYHNYFRLKTEDKQTTSVVRGEDIVVTLLMILPESQYSTRVVELEAIMLLVG